jgi:protein-S-isoprenylcysteine O-methyltransferase Ste14
VGVYIFSGVLGCVAVYALGSVVFLLGPSRISGADHFALPGTNPPPLVNGGAYRICHHPQFYLAMLLFWAIALACGSWCALVLAAFMHVSALGFLFGTELPDMRRIYAVGGVKA